MHGSTEQSREHALLLTLDEAASDAARRRTRLRAHCVADGHSIDVFFDGEYVIHVNVQGLAAADAVATLLRDPLRLYRVEPYRWVPPQAVYTAWTSLRAMARLGVFGVQM